MTTPEITQQMIEDGAFEVQVFGMANDENGDAICVSNFDDDREPEFYDVLMRPTTEDFWPNGTKDPVGEWSDLTLEQAEKKVEELERQYPGIDVEWVE